jgi:hypothetical protein
MKARLIFFIAQLTSQTLHLFGRNYVFGHEVSSVLLDLPVLRRISPYHPGCMQLSGVLGAGVLQILVV